MSNRNVAPAARCPHLIHIVTKEIASLESHIRCRHPIQYRATGSREWPGSPTLDVRRVIRDDSYGESSAFTCEGMAESAVPGLKL